MAKTNGAQLGSLIILLLIGVEGRTQFPFFFSSGNFNPPNSWNQVNASRMNSLANTNIETDTATTVGNCYFRFFSNQSAGINYAPAGNADVQITIDSPFALEVEGSAYKAYYFPTQNLTDNYVFKTTGSGSPGNARAAVLRVQGPVQSIVSQLRLPGDVVYAGQDVMVYATLSFAFSPGQGAYLRYTTDNWSSSHVIPMRGQGTQYTAQIPGNSNTLGAHINYYLFTSGEGLTFAPADADLMTINLFNNSFANFTYTPQCPLRINNAFFGLVETDKARYAPGDNVGIHTSFTDTITAASLQVTYWHLGDSMGAEAIVLSHSIDYSWIWNPPAADYSGYMIEMKLLQNGVTTDSTSIAIDVSSRWNKYPRYGFISSYPYTDAYNRELLFNSLNRYHLNGLQFYDVNYEHHKPLAGTLVHPDTIWNDIANRPTYLSTINAYITQAHNCNMLAMNYNLLYGAYSRTAQTDGVIAPWGLYYDQGHQNQVGYPLPASWASNLQVENPADTAWQHYLFGNESQLFQSIPYDGWHIDQLGNQGAVYGYNGQSVNLAASFGTYLQNAHQALNIPIVMNAVTNYGQQHIAQSPVQFLYTEVWPPFTGYNDLTALIDSNTLYSGNTLATVLAAYMDQNFSDTFGVFNTPAVLFTDAAIFASGGSHIELGDHLLSNPYFPNNNLSISCELQESLVKYYDFIVGYENLLRDSVSPSLVHLQSIGNIGLSTTASLGKIWTLAREKNNTDIFHLINLTNANTLSWNDPNGNQPLPSLLQNIPLSFVSTQTLRVKKIYVVSPDRKNGLPQIIPFQQTGQNVSFILPALIYWSTVVVEYGVATSISNVKNDESIGVFPNPFSDYINVTLSSLSFPVVNVQITDETGRFITGLRNFNLTNQPGLINLPFIDQADGIYFWSVDLLDSNGTIQERKQGKLVHLH